MWSTIPIMSAAIPEPLLPSSAAAQAAFAQQQYFSGGGSGAGLTGVGGDIDTYLEWSADLQQYIVRRKGVRRPVGAPNQSFSMAPPPAPPPAPAPPPPRDPPRPDKPFFPEIDFLEDGP